VRARPDDAGPREPDFAFPESCPNCGAENCTEEGELLDESHLTCGKPECIEKQRARDAEDREADAAAERDYVAQWRAELEDPP
jgi:hypothetical protein